MQLAQYDSVVLVVSSRRPLGLQGVCVVVAMVLTRTKRMTYDRDTGVTITTLGLGLVALRELSYHCLLIALETSYTCDCAFRIYFVVIAFVQGTVNEVMAALARRITSSMTQLNVNDTYTLSTSGLVDLMHIGLGGVRLGERGTCLPEGYSY